MKNSNKRNRRTDSLSREVFRKSALAVAVSGAFCMGGVSHVHAQEEERLEEITVIGTNIRRDSTFENDKPVQIVGQEDITRIGASQPVDLLKELTVNTGSRSSDETGNSNGASQINIRGIGFGSTLTLLNGRRAGISAISDSSGNDFVDINQFPLSAIKRIDVLTDGASAIYGSQAVAGVANIVTRKGFEGFEVSLDYRDSNTESASISFAAGHAFDRGTFNVYGTYYNQEGRSRGQIDFLQERLNGNGNPANGSLVSSTGSPGTYFRTVDDGNGGLGRVVSTRFADPDCVAAGGLFRPGQEPANPIQAQGATCRLSFFDQVSPIREEERFQLFTEFDWNFNDNIKFFHENHFSQNTATGITGQAFIGNGTATGGGFIIPGDHPFNFFVDDGNGGLLYAGPDAFAANPNLQAVDLVGTFRPFGAIASGANVEAFQDLYGNQERRTEFNYFRFVNGLEFELSNNWYASVSHSYSLNRFVDGEGGTFAADQLDAALRNGSFNPFGTAITNPGLISPRDGASTSFNEPEDVAQFLTRETNIGETKESVVDFIASGPLLETQFGQIDIAVGAQHRSIDQRFVPDSLTGAAEANSSARQFIIEGSQSVLAVFAEAIIPFHDVAELQVAVRHEDYGGTVGSTTDPKIGLKVNANDWLTFRGSWGTSFQAPTIRQTARAVSSGFLDDPASAGPGPQNAVCVDRGIAASVPIIVEGSESLVPQSADSLTLGAIFDIGESAQLSVDLWSYDYEGVIAQGQSAQAIVNADCADDGVPNDPRINRDGAGFIQSVLTSFENVDDVEATGVDVAFRYDHDAGRFGYLTLNTNLSYIDKIELNGTVDAVGSRNFSNFLGPQPEIRTNSSLSWLSGNHNANLTLRYVDSYENDQSNNAEIESYTTLDFQYGYTFAGLIGDGETGLSIGINNVFDEDPPALRTADANGNIITEAQQPIGFVNRPGYDDRSGVNLLGRTVYVRFKHSF